MEPAQFSRLGACAAAQAIAEGSISSQALIEACLAGIVELEPALGAWQFLDPARALDQARARDDERDRARDEGRLLGPLHGVPVGIKDIIDTADMPTEFGSVLHAGRRPTRDAAVVNRLRAAGAVILGKTVTTEFATYSPGKTRNPHDPSRTPGGSSSGSAAAVAAGMVPLALGTQTNASVIRPAAYCGVHGFKPSHGLIPLDGVLDLSASLDTVGCFARDLADIELLARILCPGIFSATTPQREREAAPRLAFVKSPAWERTDASTRAALGRMTASLGADCEELALPAWIADAWAWHRTIMEHEMALALDREWRVGRECLSPSLQEQLARGRGIAAVDYQQALSQRSRAAESLAAVFDRFDALLTPATAGTAPPLASTGDPAFGTLWTLCGLPAISLPLLAGDDGLPLGVQLVGARGADASLLNSARWLESRLQGT